MQEKRFFKKINTKDIIDDFNIVFLCFAAQQTAAIVVWGRYVFYLFFLKFSFHKSLPLYVM